MTAGTPCFERLQVMRDDVPRDGAMNMALDETLLNGLADLPLLRIYRWDRPTVSFGYFEPADAARRIARGREIVRRLTGGGIVEHGDDLTYSLVVPRADGFARLRSAESYRWVHEALARALERCGFASRTLSDSPSSPPAKEQPNACFERAVAHDLMAEGKKIAGGAQRRNRVGLLHQGSIRPGFVRGHGWGDRLRDELPHALAHTSENRTVSPAEISRAGTLGAAKYATSVWTDRV